MKIEELEKLPKSRKEAKLENSKYYFTGKLCPKAHFCARLTSSTDCVQCGRDNAKKTREKNREYCNLSCRNWYRENRQYALNYAKKYSDKIEVRCRTSLRQSKYEGNQCNASVDELIDRFRGICEICGVPENECNKRLSMDHCHKTGKFRGWICDNCNVGLGRFKDSPEILQKAINYLKE